MSDKGDSFSDKGKGRLRELESFPELSINQAASASTSTSTSTGQPAASASLRRGRARSYTLVGAQNPIECPISAEEHQLAELARTINHARRITAPLPPLPTLRETTPPRGLGRVDGSPEGSSGSVTPTNSATGSATPTRLTPSLTSSHQPTTPVQSSSEEATDPFRSTTPVQSSTEELTYPFRSPTAVGSSNLEATTSDSNPFRSPASSRARSASPLLSPFRSPRRIGNPLTAQLRPIAQTPPRSASTPPYIVARPIWPSYYNLVHNIPSRRSQPHPDVTDPQVRRVVIPVPSPQILASLQAASMQGYPSYIDSPQSGPGPNPRQAPPSPSQGMHQNGMNGGMASAGGMVGFPTPAGHQSDLNYIMQMVEDLSGQLAHNQDITAGIVDKMGKVRAKAKKLDLSNDELLAVAASELNDTSENLEKENSELGKALDVAVYEKKENWKLAIHGANILSDVLDKMHKFKAQHEEDTLAWHRNYRKQLSDEREENVNLRNQINDMKAAACRANEYLRQMRRYLTDHDELHELRTENTNLRQGRRMWKRMALPHIPDDDSEWSDDDDLIDPEEKKRIAAEKDEKERKDKECGEGGDVQGPGA